MSDAVLSPLDAAARLAGRRGRVLLHSADDAGGAGPARGVGRCSFVAAEPHATLIARGSSLVVLDAGGRPIRRFTDDPLDAAEAFLAEHGCRCEPRRGGAAEPRVIGYLGYDLARVVERRPGGAALGHDGPDLWLAAYGAVARWSAGELAITGADRDACTRLGEALTRPAPPPDPPVLGEITADDDAHHMARIERARDHLAAGELAEVHLGRRLIARITMPGDPLAIYAALAEVAPAPYGALLETDGTALILGSFARFLGSADGDGDDGGAPRTAGYAELLRATFPAAAVTGAPKPRAMQLIDELEPVRRGPYGGALGYFGPGGAFDLALAGRVGVIAQGELRIAIGGPITADTEATAGLAETEREAAGWIAALDRFRAAPRGD